MRERVAGVLCLGATLLLGGCSRRGRPDPEIRMAISHQRADAAAPGKDPGGAPGEVPTKLEVPPEVAKAFSGIRVAWKEKATGKEGVVEVPLGGAAPLPDPALVVRADVFLPAFTMGNGVITSDGVAPQNPAARITVFDKGKEIFGGWVFTRFPDVHPFADPRFQLRLDGGVPRPAR